MLSLLIIDDEEEAREGLRVMLEQLPDISLLGMCKNGLEAIREIIRLKPDLILLDIQMPEINGFEVLNSLPPELRPAVIFVTAYDQYALKAFEVHAIDYLLKPFTNERFFQALAHARAHVQKQSIQQKLEKLLQTYREEQNRDDAGQLITDKKEAEDLIPNRLIVKSSGKIYFLSYEEIEWVEAYDYYVKIHVKGRFFLVRESMKRMQERLPGTLFARIHKSSIIQIDQIRELEPHFNGEYMVHLKNGLKLKLSRNYKAELMNRLGRF